MPPPAPLPSAASASVLSPQLKPPVLAL